MNEFPDIALQAKDAGDADGHRRKNLSAANLCFPALDLDRDREVAGRVDPNQVDLGHSSVSVVRRGAGQRRLDVLAASHEWAEWVAGLPVSPRVQDT